MAGQVRPWPVRAVQRGTPEDVARSRQVTVASVEAREVLAEGQGGEGWEQPSLFSPWQVAA
ncbi:MAG: hypothetical protein FWH11_15195 [Micrococcales bacterium]|nr:hypothetical protein [Micrococcales bacterium]